MALFGIVMAVAGPLWAAEPVKVPLSTTVTTGDRNVYYLSPTLSYAGSKSFRLSDAKPTETITLGGVECVMRTEVSTKKVGGGLFSSARAETVYKLIIKTPTQELTFDDTSVNKPLEFTLDNGRKYVLGVNIHSYSDKASDSCCHLNLVSVQTGKIGQTPITYMEPGFDGGIAVGESTGTYRLFQSVSKYIGTPEGIFEIQGFAQDASELTLLAYSGPTASIEVSMPRGYSGPVVLTSADAGMTVTVNGTATVIPGSYTVQTALLSTATQVQGAGMPAVKVEAGGKQVVTLSGPKVLEFQTALVDGKVNIKPSEILMKGQAGETYKRVSYDAAKPPEVYLNTDGKTVLLGKMAFG